jgi:hypothetical protein
MSGHSSTSRGDRGLAGTIVRWVIFAVVVLLMLLALTPVANAVGRRGMDTWYDCVDVVGGRGWTGSSDGRVIHWPRGDGDVDIYTVGATYDIHGIDMVTSKVG